MPLVETVGLRKIYPNGGGVADLTLDIAEGQIFGFVGPDGAGKTTLLRMLCGILRPRRARFRSSGWTCGAIPNRSKPHLGYMAQRFALYRDLTVLENIRFFGALFGTPRKEVEASLERLLGFAQLWPYRSRLARDLSGGMKQKLALCCTLIHTPRLLILDEPTNGVDPVSRQEFWSMLRPLPAQGTTIIVSTGYLEEAERFDRVAFLHQGRLLMEGPPGELCSSFHGLSARSPLRRPTGGQRDLAGTPGWWTGCSYSGIDCTFSAVIACRSCRGPGRGSFRRRRVGCRANLRHSAAPGGCLHREVESAGKESPRHDASR